MRYMSLMTVPLVGTDTEERFPIADSGYYNAEDEWPATLQTVPATVRLPCPRDYADRLGNHRGYR